MADKKLLQLMKQYQDNPNVQLKIKEYIDNHLPKFINNYMEREKGSYY